MELSESPAREFDSYTLNEAILDRLEQLNYESEFVKLSPSFRTIPRHYFVKSHNIGEQFFLFTSLAVWLMKKLGIESIEYPQEFDDPNSTISTIIAVLKTNDISVDYSISSVKKGSGPACLFVLGELSTLAFKRQEICDFEKFGGEFVVEGTGDEDDADEESGYNAEVTAENFDGDDSDSTVNDEDVNEANQFDSILDQESLLLAGDTADAGKTGPLEYIIASDTQTAAFRAEVERAIPQLKITIRADARDWRAHVEQLNKQIEVIHNHIEQVKPFLLESQREIEASHQRIEVREKHVNQQLNTLLTEYRKIKDKIALKNEEYREASGGINKRTEQLRMLGEEVDQLKQQIEEQADRNNDAAPLIRIKQAITKLRSQVVTMDVQIGVIEQSLFLRRIRTIAYINHSITTYD